MDPEQFRRLGHQLIDWIASYLGCIEELPIRSSVQPGQIFAALPDEAPERGEPWEVIIGDLDRIVTPGLTHWQSPGFFAYFPANGSFPAILGDLVSTGLGVNGMLWATSPAATEIEMRVLDWLGRMIGLPDDFLFRSADRTGGGVIQGTASEATLVAMVAARTRTLRSVAARGVSAADAASRLMLYTSTQAHSSVIKAAMIAGLAAHAEDRTHLRLIDVDRGFALDPDRLGHQIAHDEAAGMIPCFVCATVGTTSSTAIDPIDRIGPLCNRPGSAPSGGTRVWLHVDAAMAGAACICPEFRHLLQGIEHADSVSFNPHKWLLTSFDLAAMWTRDRRAIIDALSITPEYLRNAATSGALGAEVVDYRDWQIPLGRRFRALKLWFVIRHYGVEGLRAYIREHMRLAALFEALVRADRRFELLAPRPVSLICFRLRPLEGEDPAATDARNARLLEAVNASGRVLLSHTVLPIRTIDGVHQAFTVRMAIGGSRTQQHHVLAAWKLIQSVADDPAVCLRST